MYKLGREERICLYCRRHYVINKSVWIILLKTWIMNDYIKSNEIRSSRTFVYKILILKMYPVYDIRRETRSDERWSRRRRHSGGQWWRRKQKLHNKVSVYHRLLNLKQLKCAGFTTESCRKKQTQKRKSFKQTKWTSPGIKPDGSTAHGRVCVCVRRKSGSLKQRQRRRKHSYRSAGTFTHKINDPFILITESADKKKTIHEHHRSCSRATVQVIPIHLYFFFFNIYF